jgi:hypothetical protein
VVNHVSQFAVAMLLTQLSVDIHVERMVSQPLRIRGKRLVVSVPLLPRVDLGSIGQRFSAYIRERGYLLASWAPAPVTLLGVLVGPPMHEPGKDLLPLLVV